jgi:D-alanyl-D-alanine carboxypeptidase
MQVGGALLAALASPAGALPSEPMVTARAAVVMDAATGQVLWERDASTPLPPASTTKVMTAVLALESGRLDDSLRVSGNAARQAPSKINLRPGQRLRLRDLVYAALLNSANDAATVIPEGLAGSEEAFAVRMNDKARALGARTAHFVNPHGLTAPGHVASARDLATIFRYGLGLAHFRTILATRSTRVPVESPRTRWVSLRSHNRLLATSAYPVIGKTGYTRAARRCFVGSAVDDGREIIIALLGSTNLWDDAQRLIDFGLGVAADRSGLMVASVPAETPRARGRGVRSEGDDEAPGAVRFAVQLGPYSTRNRALVTRARLTRRGYAARLAGRAVRVGSYSSRERAAAVADRLKSRGYRPLVVALN